MPANPKSLPVTNSNRDTAPSVINVTGLSKRYGAGEGSVLALGDVSFSIKDGEFISVVGPSGCGKTTLLKILSGLEKKTTGEVSLRGQAVTGPRRDIGIVFQSPVLFPWRTVLENVLLPVDVLKLDRAKYRQQALALLDMAGLAAFVDRYPMELSGGMQQRVGLVRALIHQPALLLMDEPFGALDAMTRENMNLELQRIWMETKKTVLFITHSIAEAIFLSDRVLVMKSRPSELLMDLPVELPRPRSLEMMNSAAFGEKARIVRELLNSGGAIE
jgi:NitT/TauT family transport system ATP-binding protein